MEEISIFIAKDITFRYFPRHTQDILTKHSARTRANSQKIVFRGQKPGQETEDDPEMKVESDIMNETEKKEQFNDVEI